MAKKYTRTVADGSITFTDDKGKVDKMDLVVPMDQGEIVNTLSKEINGRGDVTRSSLTAILAILDCPRMDTYGGQTAIGEKLPKVVKDATSEEEVRYFQPLFYAYWDNKNPAPDATDMRATMVHSGARSAAWTTWIGSQRNGGIYGNCKSYALQYLIYFGKLPCVYDGDKPQKEKLLPVSAMAKEIQIAKAAANIPNEGIAGELQQIAQVLADAKTGIVYGSTVGAIVALKAIMAVYEARYTAETINNADKQAVMAQADTERMTKAEARKENAPEQEKPAESAPMPAVDVPNAMGEAMTKAKGKSKAKASA